MIKCSKCSFENEDNANFCASCGKPLDEEKAIQNENNQEYECPKCGHRFVGKQKYCSECGLEFNWPEGNYDSIPVKVKDHKSDKKPVKNSNISKPKEQNGEYGLFDIIAHAVSIGAVLLALIGVWLNAVNIPGLGDILKMDVSFWFDTFWDGINSTAQPLYGAFALFIIAIGCVLGFGIYSIVLSIKGLVQKKPFRKQLFTALAVVPVFVYFVSFRSCLYESTVLLSTKMGAGHILSLVSVILLLIAIIGYRVATSIARKDINIMKTVLDCCMSLCVFLALIILPLAALKTSTGSGGILAFSIEFYSLKSYSGSLEALNILMTAFFYCVVVLLGVYLILVSLGDDKKNNNTRMSMLSTAMVLSIALLIVTCIMIVEYNDQLNHYSYSDSDISINYAPILSLIFVAGAFGCSIAGSQLNKEQN